MQDAVLTAQGWALQVSADRMIAVDTPPVLSPSVLAALHRAQGQGRSAGAGVPAPLPAELQLELHALQLTVRFPSSAAIPHATRSSCALTADGRHVMRRRCYWRRATWWWW